MQGFLLQIRYLERGLCKSFKKVNFFFRNVCHPYATRVYSYVIRMSLVCTRMSFVCTGMSSVRHSYVLVCYLYVTRMCSYVIRISLACTHMSSVCHSYVIRMSLVCGFTMILILTLWRRTPISYGNQSIVLQSKSMDWLLYDIGLRHERVKVSS